MRQPMRTLLAWTTILAAATLAGGLSLGRAQESTAPATPVDRSDDGLGLRQQVQAVEPSTSSPTKGHYQTLLRTLEVAKDKAEYGDFYDYGYWSGTSYAGQDNLPPGYWVYLAPNWYIFKDASAGTPGNPRTPRGWGPEQATGAPDTWPNSGDLTTAWASATPDGQREWLELTYDAPFRPVAVMIYETYNPGAVDRVTGFAEGRVAGAAENRKDEEVELWAGADPTPTGKDKGVSVIPLHPEFNLSRIRIYLDSPKVPGWNEIDAVGLLDEKGTIHWATGATASSTYADRSAPLQPGEAGVERLDLKLER